MAASFDIPGAPTINEILYNKPEHNGGLWFSTLFHYTVGQLVKFKFYGSIRIGKITTLDRSNPRLPHYHILAAGGRWYRHIYEGDIIKTAVS